MGRESSSGRGRIPPDGLRALEKLIAGLPPHQREIVRAAFRRSLSEYTRLDVRSLWSRPLPERGSFLALLLSPAAGDETFAKNLLWWREKSAHHDGRVRCLAAGSAECEVVRTLFEVSRLPRLLVGGDPRLDRMVQIDDGLLARLAEGEDDLMRFLTEIHHLVSDDPSLRKLSRTVWTKRALAGIEVGLDRVSGIISVSAGVSRNV